MTTSYETWQAEIEQMHLAELEAERVATALMRERAAAFADAVADYPLSWNWGDGYGGAVTDLILRELAARGFTRTPPTYPDDRKPKRAPMSATRRVEVFERDGFACVRCGARKALSVDHIVPISKGGSDEDENLQTLCRSCNSSKGVQV